MPPEPLQFSGSRKDNIRSHLITKLPTFANQQSPYISRSAPPFVSLAHHYLGLLMWDLQCALVGPYRYIDSIRSN